MADFFNGGLTSGGTATSSTQLPAWLQNYTQGVAGKAIDIANRPYQTYPGQRLADFTPDQNTSFNAIRANQGNWKPALNTANDNISAAGQYGKAAQSSVAGDAQKWGNNWQSYMSPYTSAVTNEISRLGNQNLNENLIPSVQDKFLGSGQFGSTRNADILGRTVRDAQADISGKQAQALESGYGTSANIFNSDANRQQQQQQLQAQTNLGAGALSNNSAQIGNTLANTTSNLSSQDANALYGIGAKQQALNQAGLDIGYQDFQNQRDYDKNNLNWLTGVANGLPRPGQTTTSSAQTPSTSAASYLTAGAGLMNKYYPDWLSGLSNGSSPSSSPATFGYDGIKDLVGL